MPLRPLPQWSNCSSKWLVLVNYKVLGGWLCEILISSIHQHTPTKYTSCHYDWSQSSKVGQKVNNCLKICFEHSSTSSCSTTQYGSEKERSMRLSLKGKKVPWGRHRPADPFQRRPLGTHWGQDFQPGNLIKLSSYFMTRKWLLSLKLDKNKVITFRKSPKDIGESQLKDFTFHFVELHHPVME